MKTSELIKKLQEELLIVGEDNEVEIIANLGEDSEGVLRVRHYKYIGVVTSFINKNNTPNIIGTSTTIICKDEEVLKTI